MEASAVVEATPEVVTATFDGEAEATRSTEELFQWSEFVHVGKGAAECPDATNGKCKDFTHFHAWVTLPNAFQVRDITDKARAAKARKTRDLRDPETDAGITMEMDMEDAWVDRHDGLLDDMAERKIEEALVDIINDLSKDERFENQQQDAEEFRRQLALPDDQRDTEDFERLSKDMEAYTEVLTEEIDKVRKSERRRLGDMTKEQVLAIERKWRIEQVSREFYFHTYYTWAMYVGTRQPSETGFPIARRFKAWEELKSAPVEVVAALRDAIRELEQRTSVRSDAAGNS